MRRVTIVIETGNDAFKPLPEIELARILREVAGRLENEGIPGNPSHLNGARLRDVNGNTVGTITID